MKKSMLILAAICMTMAANARILRVSNVSGSSAPYSSIEAAHEAASSGDTIMVDGSNTEYGDIEITKQIVLIGPGFWRIENGIIQEGVNNAIIGNVNVKVEGVIIKGLYIKNTINMYASRLVINRCNINSTYCRENISNCVFHQNYIRTSGFNNNYAKYGTYFQITNNIFHDTSASSYMFHYLKDSYIAYNTFAGNSGTTFDRTKGCTYEHNIWRKITIGTNEESDNYTTDFYASVAGKNKTDKDVYNTFIPDNANSKYGAFAGDSPYVLSGVPSGPVIQDLIVPTTVEMGSKMNVTIKVGVQK